MAEAGAAPVSGQCLCGGVSYTINGPLRDVFDCHCHRCRRWTGHHMAATQALASDVTFGSDDPLRWYSPVFTAEDPSVEYGFCGTCGSSLFWRVVGSDRISICAGPLNPPTGLRTISAWWLSESSDYADMSPGIADRRMTE
jgi:hypothetical protein